SSAFRSSVFLHSDRLQDAHPAARISGFAILKELRVWWAASGQSERRSQHAVIGDTRSQRSAETMENPRREVPCLVQSVAQVLRSVDRRIRASWQESIVCR